MGSRRGNTRQERYREATPRQYARATITASLALGKWPLPPRLVTVTSRHTRAAVDLILPPRRRRALPAMPP